MTTIYQKLLELRKSVLYLQKDTQGHNYNYTSGTTLMSQIRPKMDELGLLLFTSVKDQSMQVIEKKTSKGTSSEYLVSGYMVYTWVNSENSEEKVVTELYGAGADSQDPSKAIGKMMTYFERYNLLKTFQIATDNDDPDKFQQKAEVVAEKSMPKQAKEDKAKKEAEKLEKEREFYIHHIQSLQTELGNTGADIVIDCETKSNMPTSKMPLNYLKGMFQLLNDEKIKLVGKKKSSAKAIKESKEETTA